MALKKLDLVIKNQNECSIYGVFTVEYVASIDAAGKSFISGAEKPCLDFSAVTIADSSGVAMIINWWSYAVKHGKKIIFKHLSAEILAIMKVSDINILLGL